jgi:mono/diheme cytochrome c family protein
MPILRAAALASLMFGVVVAPCAARDATQTVVGRMAALRADAPSLAETTNARSHYVLHCAGCHGLDGSGSIAGQVPDLRRMGAFLGLRGGREYLVRVPGVRGTGLDDAQTAQLLNWVLDTLARGSTPAGQAPHYDAAEVARARGLPLVDVAGERQRLMNDARVLGVSLY